MDEILIEDKKYISSKRAAKITGYAKDYIGQLCREGRVPARLIGRSWYVLEAAINDHRFGDQEIGVDNTADAESPTPSFPPTWESPRYEASPAEPLPSVNRLQDADQPIETTDKNDISQNLQDSWRAWFDRVADAGATPHATYESDEGSKGEPEEVLLEIKEEEEVTIPIHHLHRRPLDELLPQRHVEIQPPTTGETNRFEKAQTKRGRKGVLKVINTTGALIAAILFILAAINTGYFDSYIISSGHAGFFAGITSYNK